MITSAAPMTIFLIFIAVLERAARRTVAMSRRATRHLVLRARERIDVSPTAPSSVLHYAYVDGPTTTQAPAEHVGRDDGFPDSGESSLLHALESVAARSAVDGHSLAVSDNLVDAAIVEALGDRLKAEREAHHKSLSLNESEKPSERTYGNVCGR
jgi:hypothetical protein